MKCFDTSTSKMPVIISAKKSKEIRQKLCNRTLRKKSFKNQEFNIMFNVQTIFKNLFSCWLRFPRVWLWTDTGKNIWHGISINIIIQPLKSTGGLTCATQFKETYLTIIILFYTYSSSKNWLYVERLMYSDALMLNCMLTVRYQLFLNRATSFIKKNTDYFNRLINNHRIMASTWPIYEERDSVLF